MSLYELLFPESSPSDGSATPPPAPPSFTIVLLALSFTCCLRLRRRSAAAAAMSAYSERDGNIKGESKVPHVLMYSYEGCLVSIS